MIDKDSSDHFYITRYKLSLHSTILTSMENWADIPELYTVNDDSVKNLHSEISAKFSILVF